VSRFNVRVPRRHAGRRQPSTLALAWVLGLAALTPSAAWAAPDAPSLQAAPALRAQQATLAGSSALAPAASTLPDPRLSVGIENLPIAGPDRWSTTRDAGTMQRIALMQEMPNRAKRDAREQVAQARIERDRATLAATELAVRREAGLAWLAVHFAEARLSQVPARPCPRS
jgi:hypothetical protein